MTSMKNFPTHPDQTITEPKKVGSVPCHRCGGTGFVPPWGTCFRCGGLMSDPTERQWLFPASWTQEARQAWDADRQAKNEASRQRAAEKRQAKRDETFAHNIEQAPSLDGIFPIPEWLGTFARDIAFKAQDFDLSLKQAAAFEKAFAEDKARHENKAQADADREAEKATIPAWENGRQMVEGVVKTRRFQDSDFGTVCKIRLVTAEGQGLWVTEPSAIVTEVGDRVRMNVTVEVSEDDHTFAFGKRPAKAEVVERVEA